MKRQASGSSERADQKRRAPETWSLLSREDWTPMFKSYGKNHGRRMTADRRGQKLESLNQFVLTALEPGNAVNTVNVCVQVAKFDTDECVGGSRLYYFELETIKSIQEKLEALTDHGTVVYDSEQDICYVKAKPVSRRADDDQDNDNDHDHSAADDDQDNDNDRDQSAADDELGEHEPERTDQTDPTDPTAATEHEELCLELVRVLLSYHLESCVFQDGIRNKKLDLIPFVYVSIA